MKRFRQAVAVTVGAGALALGVVGVTGVATAGAAAPAQSSGSGAVTVKDNFFQDDEITVTAGTKVTWTNKGNIIHNITPVKSTPKFGTKALNKGKKYSFTFKKPGEYAYYCSFHGSPSGGQHGTIVVKAAPPVTTMTTAAAG